MGLQRDLDRLALENIRLVELLNAQQGAHAAGDGTANVPGAQPRIGHHLRNDAAATLKAYTKEEGMETSAALLTCADDLIPAHRASAAPQAQGAAATADGSVVLKRHEGLEQGADGMSDSFEVDMLLSDAIMEWHALSHSAAASHTGVVAK